MSKYKPLLDDVKKELIDYGYEFKRLSLKERWVIINKIKWYVIKIDETDYYMI